MSDIKATSNPSAKPKNEPKLVRATDLPTYGNPYPPKDVVIDEAPGMLETKIRSMRQLIQPYTVPIASAYEKTSEIVSIGVSHSESTMQNLAQNQSSIVNALIIAGSSLVGMALARRRGIFKKLLFGSVFFGGAMVACYPKDAEEKAQLLWYITKNKLPDLAKQQYQKFTSKEPAQQDNATPKVTEK